MNRSTRLLAISDIHGNVSAVQQLREREPNRFDGVVVAGDIGSNAASEIFSILSSFKCPVFYVYGNHDHDLAYEEDFGAGCHHLHMRVHSCGPFTICGFSGCPAQWGQNPIWLRLLAAADDTHRSVVSAVADARRSFEEALDNYGTSTGSGREEACGSSLLSRRRRALLDLENSPAYFRYQVARQDAYERTLDLNYRELLHILRAQGVISGRLIVVTHERLQRLQAGFSSPCLHVFGHKHRFADKTRRGFRYVNVSALDQEAVFRLRSPGADKGVDCKVVNAGTYAIIEQRSAGKLDIFCAAFETPGGDWVPVTRSQIEVTNISY